MWQDYYSVIKGSAGVYLFVIAGHALVVGLGGVLQPLVFRRLPHHGAPPPARYFPGATCPQSAQIATAPISGQPTHLLSQSLSQPAARSTLSLGRQVQGSACYSQFRVTLFQMLDSSQYSHLHCLPHLGWVSIWRKWPDNEFLIFTQWVQGCVQRLTRWSDFTDDFLQTVILHAAGKHNPYFLHWCVQDSSSSVKKIKSDPLIEREVQCVPFTSVVSIFRENFKRCKTDHFAKIIYWSLLSREARNSLVGPRCCCSQDGAPGGCSRGVVLEGDKSVRLYFSRPV